MRVSVGDVELHVHEKGEGRPLVALHGGPGLDGSVWFPALDPLAEDGWRILAPDHRANGRSENGDPDRWTVPQMADDVEELRGRRSRALIRQLDITGIIVRFGGRPAQPKAGRAAARHR
jgi:pimeloyl-ACP methyl ester carboxylesterase